MSLKEIVVGGVLTVMIGGTAYTVNKADVAENLAQDTGMSQHEAQSYVDSVKEEDLRPYDEVGQEYVDDSKVIFSQIAQIDCAEYQYEWEAPALTCAEGLSQLREFGDAERLVGRAYIRLASDSASKSDIRSTIAAIDRLTTAYDYPIIKKLYTAAEVKEAKNNNSYNRALLKTVLDAE